MKNSVLGFTFAELMVALAVAAILVGVAVPSFRTTIASNKLTIAANDYIYAVSEARSQGMRRNAVVLFCGSTGNPSGGDLGTLSSACAGAGTVVSPLLDADSNVTADLVSQPPQVGNGIGIGAVPPILFTGRGFGRLTTSNAPYSGLVADIYSDQIQQNNHRCIYLIAGSSLRSCTTSSACPSNEPTPCS